MSLVTSIARSLARPSVTRLQASDGPIAFDEWIGMLNGYAPFILNPINGTEEEIVATAQGLQRALVTNGVVFACELVRVMLFSEARFQFRERNSGKPGRLFGTPDLSILERPDGIGSTTAGMLKMAMLHADYGGTAFLVRRGDRIIHPRPDWMTIVIGSETDAEMPSDALDAKVIGFLYHPGGRGSGSRPEALLPEDVATFVAGLRDPFAKVRGIPWPAAVSRNIMSHNAATTHKLKFFENGATPQIVVTLGGLQDPKKFREWVNVLEQDHKGSTNAYRTLYLAAGSVATPVGKDLQQLDFKATQGADETLIAAASGVGAVVAQLSEGMQGSSLNAGNFAQAMRRASDLVFRPMWRDMAGSLQALVPPPASAELWYDDRDIPALKDDIRDRAEVQYREAASMRTLYDGGWKPATIVEAVQAYDWDLLEHSGLPSVQNQPAGRTPPRATPEVAATSPMPQLMAGDEPLDIRCPGCDRLVGKRTAPGGGFETKCRGCGELVAA